MRPRPASALAHFSNSSLCPQARPPPPPLRESATVTRVMTDRVINSESPPRVINRLLTTRIYPHQPASTLVAPGAVNLRCGHFTAAIPYRRSYRRSGSRPSESLAGPPPSIPASTSPMSTSSKRSPTSAGFFRALLDVQWPSRSSGAV